MDIWNYKDYGLSVKNFNKKYNNIKKYILHPGDMLHLPKKITHTVNSLISEHSNLNISIACSIIINEPDTSDCNKAFYKVTPQRILELNRGEI